MATNVYIKHNNERSIEELNYIEELKKVNKYIFLLLLKL